MFFNTGAVDRIIKTVGESISIYETARTTTSRTTLKAEVQPVEATDFNLVRAGLRPLLDVVANVPHDTEVSRGWAVKKGDDWYNVTRIEVQEDGQGVVVSKRLLLTLLSPGSRDMRS